MKAIIERKIVPEYQTIYKYVSFGDLVCDYLGEERIWRVY